MSADNQPKYVWYRDRTFWFCVGGETTLWALATLGTSLVDGALNLQATYVFGPAVVLTFGLAILLRKNP